MEWKVQCCLPKKLCLICGEDGLFQLASGRYKSRILTDIEQPVERNCLIQHVSRDDIRISRWILLARSPKGASVTAVPCLSMEIMKVRELEVGIGWHLKAFWPFLCTIFEKKNWLYNHISGPHLEPWTGPNNCYPGFQFQLFENKSTTANASYPSTPV